MQKTLEYSPDHTNDHTAGREMLRARPRTSVPRDDALHRWLRSRLRKDPAIRATDIRVVVDQGQVTIRGVVNGYWKKQRVVDHALELHGVSDVVDNLAVVPKRRVDDDDIIAEIRARLRRSTAVDPAAIDVWVQHGAVTLRGTVTHWADRQTVFDAARFVEGVTALQCLVEVRV